MPSIHTPQTSVVASISHKPPSQKRKRGKRTKFSRKDTALNILRTGAIIARKELTDPKSGLTPLARFLTGPVASGARLVDAALVVNMAAGAIACH